MFSYLSRVIALGFLPGVIHLSDVFLFTVSESEDSFPYSVSATLFLRSMSNGRC